MKREEEEERDQRQAGCLLIRLCGAHTSDPECRRAGGFQAGT